MENNLSEFDFNDFLGFIIQGFVNLPNRFKNIDFKKIGNNISDFFKHFDVHINKWVDVSVNYFKSLTMLELFGWIALGLGFIMVLIALISW